MLAAHFESVVQQPGAALRLPGVCLHLPALGGLLAKWGLRLEHVENGRSLSSIWSAKGPSKEQLVHAESVAKSSYDQMVHRVASERGIRERDVRRLMGGTWWSWTMGFFGGSRKRGWISGAEAQRAKLIDGSLYADGFEALVAQKCDEGAGTCTVHDYHLARTKQMQLAAQLEAATGMRLGGGGSGQLWAALASVVDALHAGALMLDAAAGADESWAIAPRLSMVASRALPSPDAGQKTAKADAAKTDDASGQATTVGVVRLQGRILPAGSPAAASPSSSPPCVSVEAARCGLRAARDDPSIAAVVLCIDSPGGDALAADAIRREV